MSLFTQKIRQKERICLKNVQIYKTQDMILDIEERKSISTVALGVMKQKRFVIKNGFPVSAAVESDY